MPRQIPKPQIPKPQIPKPQILKPQIPEPSGRSKSPPSPADACAHQISGIRLAVCSAGLRTPPRDDLVLFALAKDSQVAALFTTNTAAAAPVCWSRQQIGQSSPPRALLVNSGHANACCGALGDRHAVTTATAAAAALGCQPSQVLLASTGVIGEPLPAEKICAALPALAKDLTPQGWERAARAIHTTDRQLKLTHRTAQIGGQTVRLTAMAKGAGMIAPNMATMLAFIFTDARLPQAVLQVLLNQAAEDSFHAISVDGDCSPNDSVFLIASGAVDTPQPAVPRLSQEHKKDPDWGENPDWREDADWGELADFYHALCAACQELAQAIVGDGEGARRVITFRVQGAESKTQARQVARALGTSILVKTAFAGGLPNWGRLLSAAGASGAACDLSKARLFFGQSCAFAQGRAGASDEILAAELAGSEALITLDLASGSAQAQFWTCDLTHEYITINSADKT